MSEGQRLVYNPGVDAYEGQDAAGQMMERYLPNTAGLQKATAAGTLRGWPMAQRWYNL